MMIFVLPNIVCNIFIDWRFYQICEFGFKYFTLKKTISLSAENFISTTTLATAGIFSLVIWINFGKYRHTVKSKIEI
jgi:hypothetical protein